MEWDLRSTSDFNSNNTSELHRGFEKGRGRRISQSVITMKKPACNTQYNGITCLVEIGIGNGGELSLDGLQESHSNIEPIVSIMGQLCWVSNGSKWASSLCLHIEGPS